MRLGLSFVVVAMCVALASCATPVQTTPLQQAVIAPPVAKIVPQELEKHGDLRVDNRDVAILVAMLYRPIARI